MTSRYVWSWALSCTFILAVLCSTPARADYFSTWIAATCDSRLGMAAIRFGYADAEDAPLFMRADSSIDHGLTAIPATNASQEEASCSLPGGREVRVRLEIGTMEQGDQFSVWIDKIKVSHGYIDTEGENIKLPFAVIVYRDGFRNCQLSPSDLYDVTTAGAHSPPPAIDCDTALSPVKGPTDVFAASFDCTKAATQIEKMICGDPNLSELDKDLGAAYQSALQNEKQADVIRSDQKQWMRTRNSCQDTSCIKHAYEERLSQLRQIAVPLEAPSSGQLACAKSTDLQLPYSFYVVESRGKMYAKPVAARSASTQAPIVVANAPSDIMAARLCDGGIVAVWLPTSYGSFQTFLTARVFDEKFIAHTQEFRVTETDEAQWEHSVGTLYNGGFVVSWKTSNPNNKRTSRGITIRARIFDSQGHPLTKSFDVSASSGDSYRASAYGLSNGDFVVVWDLSGRIESPAISGSNYAAPAPPSNSVLLRIFDRAGNPKTAEISVLNANRDCVTGYYPYIYASGTGVFNVFMQCRDNSYAEIDFTRARSFDERGTPLTDTLEGPSISKLEGYQQTIDLIEKRKVPRLDSN